MREIRDPEEMSEWERFEEVACILADGVCRLKKRTGYLAAMSGPRRDDADGRRGEPQEAVCATPPGGRHD